MSIAAFVLIAFMITVYVLLDGYDLGVATITPLVARSDRQREGSMRSIGPFWNGNEVWLIAGGAALFALFPKAYASSFSGFYLPFIVVLWLSDVSRHCDGVAIAVPERDLAPVLGFRALPYRARC